MRISKHAFRSRYAPPTVDAFRQHQPTCEHCSQRIVFVEMADSGKSMPVDPDWQAGDGRRHLIVQDEELKGHLVQHAPPHVTGRRPHWATCPELRRQREERRRRQGVGEQADLF